MTTEQKIKATMAEVLRAPVERLHDDALLTELVNDSFVLIDMVIELQDSYDVILVQDDIADVKTVGDLIAVVVGRQNENVRSLGANGSPTIAC